MSAADGLAPAMRAATWRTLIGLLAVTGMRQGEACRLGRDDVDLGAGRSSSATPSSASPGWCSCTRPRSPRCAPMRRPATRRSPSRRRPRSSSTAAAGRWTGTTSRTRSPRWSRRRASRPRPGGAPRGCMTCGTCSPSRRCWTGTATAGTCRPGSRCCPPGSATSTRSPPTGTCRPSPSSSPWQPAGSNAGGRAGGPVTDLAPILQGFFTDRLARQKKASPNTVAAYRDTCKLLLAFAQDKTGKPPSRLSLADLDATLIGAFLQHLEERAGERQRHPERPAGRHPLPVPLRGPAGTRARRRDQPGPGHPAPAPRARHRQLPHPGGNRRAARRPRPGNLARPPRPRPAPARRPDRAAGIRAHRPRPPGRPPGRRPARPLPRQGPQGQGNPAHRPDRQGAQDLARRARPRPDGPLFPTRSGGRLSRDAVERLVAKHAATAASRLPVDQGEERHPAHAQAHRRHVAPEGPESTPRSSPSGSATRTRKPPRSTSTPT